MIFAVPVPDHFKNTLPGYHEEGKRFNPIQGGFLSERIKISCLKCLKDIIAPASAIG
jgi:hypothetical protein